MIKIAHNNKYNRLPKFSAISSLETNKVRIEIKTDTKAINKKALVLNLKIKVARIIRKKILFLVVKTTLR